MANNIKARVCCGDSNEHHQQINLRKKEKVVEGSIVNSSDQRDRPLPLAKPTTRNEGVKQKGGGDDN